MDPQPCWRWDGPDLILRVRVQPRSGRDALAGVQDGRLRVRLAAAPVDGKANAGLRRLLAELFGVPPSAVLLEAGETARDKRLRVRAPWRLPPELAGAGEGH